MGAKDSWTMGYNNDENNYNKKGKQTEAIMRMIEQLKKPKEAKYDLTKMPGDMGPLKTLSDNKWKIAGADPLLQSGDRWGVLLSFNGRNNFASFFLP